MGRTIICKRCGKTVENAGSRTVFCRDCVKLNAKDAQSRGRKSRSRRRFDIEKSIYQKYKAMTRNCEDCHYFRSMGQGDKCCHYLLMLGVRRPCPPGDECTVKVKTEVHRRRKKAYA